jgi:hypothetical protein
MHFQLSQSLDHHDGETPQRIAGGSPDRARGPALAYRPLAALAVVYLAVFVALDGLRFAVRRDEVHFWPTTLRFSRTLLPSAELLRSYGELNTPLPFILWGTSEQLFRGGVFGARLLDFLLSFGVVALVTVLAGRSGRAGADQLVPAVGILLFPYFLFVSTHVYTDILPTALVALGVVLHLRGRYWWAALLFALAIAGRQYMVAFPAALVVYELLASRESAFRPVRAWLAPALAAATLGGWYLFFGGFGPPGEIAAQAIVTADAEALIPRNSLYFLACTGLYFVVPALALTPMRLAWRDLRRPAGLAAAGVLLLLFVLFPPIQNENFPIPTMGYFDRGLRWLPDAVRIAVFYLFALLAVGQLRTRRLPFLLLLANAALMAKAHIAWDKYVLALVVVLWSLEAMSRRAPAPLASASP